MNCGAYFPIRNMDSLLVDQRASQINKCTTLSDELYKWLANALLSLCLFSISAWVCTLSGLQSVMAKISYASKETPQIRAHLPHAEGAVVDNWVLSA